MTFNNNEQAFFALVKAGLWEKDTQLSAYSNLNYTEVYRLAEEQAVVGLVASGLEHVPDVKIPKEDVLQFVGYALQIEPQNKSMNEFIACLIDRMRKESIYTLLLKGQSVGQCYERPFWRACGDVDLFMSDDNYAKAQALLTSLATSVEKEDPYTKHIGMMIDKWQVEMHGNLRCGFSFKADKMLDDVRKDTFFNGNVRSCNIERTQIFLLSAENDVVYVFTHILHHFFRGGIGLRQICDWCRLLWTYRDKLNTRVVESRISQAGLMTEWKAFAALAVNYLGMPQDAMPFYDTSRRWSRKAKRIVSRILHTGNFGHNIDESYRKKKSFIARKGIAVWRYFSEAMSHFLIFSMDSLRAFGNTFKTGLLSTLKFR